jgi:hypothetical protein
MLILLVDTAVRNYLTTLIWYRDHLCSLSSAYLWMISLGSMAGLAGLAAGAIQFQDDLVFLLFDGDLTTVSVVFGLLLLISIALWLLSCCLAALGRRVILYFRGL